jgi:5-methylcytosine-specific restriction endonuclease McrA
MAGGDLHKRTKKPNDNENKAVQPRSRSKQGKIPSESKKRSTERIYYKQVKDEMRAEMKANGTYNCFFCGLPMGDEMFFHHLKGRDGDLYIDRNYLVPAHNDCHVFRYHRLSIEFLIKETWYDGFLSRLKAKDAKLYETELKKQYKAGLFDDDGI